MGEGSSGEVSDRKHVRFVRGHYINSLSIWAFAGIFLGFDTGYAPQAHWYIKDKFPEVQRSKSLEEAIVRMVFAGASIGVMLGKYMNDKLGRKPSFLASSISMFCGFLPEAMAKSCGLIIVGRILVAMGVGMLSTTLPLYLSEVALAKHRARFISLYGITVILGQLAGHTLHLNDSVHKQIEWYVLHASASRHAFTYMVSTCILDESPKWLCRKGKKDEAMKILKKLFRGDELHEEVQALTSSMGETTPCMGKILPLVKDEGCQGLTVRRRVRIFEQFIGLNVLIYYGLGVLRFAGISKSMFMALSLFVSCVTVLCAFLAY